MTKNKYGIAIIADLEGAFDSVGRLGALYKLHKTGISESSFMRNCQQRNLVNIHIDEWSKSETGVLQGSIKSPLIFLLHIADMTAEEQNKSDNKSNESKYADDFNFWRLHNNYYTLLVNVQLAIINLKTWCSKWQISLNISETKYMVFCDKKTHHHHQIYQ